MGLHYCVICDNCEMVEIDYHPRAALAVKPSEIIKRYIATKEWKKYADGTILCRMCAHEFAGYRKDNANWLKEAQQDKRNQIPRLRG